MTSKKVYGIFDSTKMYTYSESHSLALAETTSISNPINCGLSELPNELVIHADTAGSNDTASLAVYAGGNVDFCPERITLTGHAILHVFQSIPPNIQIDVRDSAKIIFSPNRVVNAIHADLRSNCEISLFDSASFNAIDNVSFDSGFVACYNSSFVNFSELGAFVAFDGSSLDYCTVSLYDQSKVLYNSRTSLSFNNETSYSIIPIDLTGEISEHSSDLHYAASIGIKSQDDFTPLYPSYTTSFDLLPGYWVPYSGAPLISTVEPTTIHSLGGESWEFICLSSSSVYVFADPLWIAEFNGAAYVPIDDSEDVSDPDGGVLRVTSDEYVIDETFPHEATGPAPKGGEQSQNAMYTTLKLYDPSHTYATVYMPSGFFVAYSELGDSRVLYVSEYQNKVSFPLSYSKTLDSNILFACEDMGNLVVFTEASIYLFEGSKPNPMIGYKIRDRYPVVDINTIIKTRIGLLYLSNEGLMSISGAKVSPVIDGAILARQLLSSDIIPGDVNSRSIWCYEQYCVIHGVDKYANSLIFDMNSPSETMSQVVFHPSNSTGLTPVTKFTCAPLLIDKPVTIRYVRVVGTKAGETVTLKASSVGRDSLEVVVKTGHVVAFNFGSVKAQSYIQFEISNFYNTTITGVTFGSSPQEINQNG